MSMEPGKDLGYCVIGPLLYAAHLGSTENINKRFPGAPSSNYFCQNEILHNERVNGLLSKFFFIFYRHLSFVFTVRQKIFPPCNSKTLYIMFTDSRDGIRKRTLSLGFLGIILRVLRLEVSTLVFCFLQTSIHELTWVFFIDWLFCMDFWKYRASIVFCQVFLLCLHL
jgi:hypothetical protein